MQNLPRNKKLQAAKDMVWLRCPARHRVQLARTEAQRLLRRTINKRPSSANRVYIDITREQCRWCR